MLKFLKTYLPAISIVFTFIILYASINNILNGYDKEGFCIFILQVIGYLSIAMLIDFLVSLINFKKFIHHFIVETVLLYPITFGFVIIGKWFQVNIFNFIWCSCIYLIAMILIHYYFYYLTKRQAIEINSILHYCEKE